MKTRIDERGREGMCKRPPSFQLAGLIVVKKFYIVHCSSNYVILHDNVYAFNATYL